VRGPGELAAVAGECDRFGAVAQRCGEGVVKPVVRRPLVHLEGPRNDLRTGQRDRPPVDPFSRSREALNGVPQRIVVQRRGDGLGPGVRSRGLLPVHALGLGGGVRLLGTTLITCRCTTSLGDKLAYIPAVTQGLDDPAGRAAQRLNRDGVEHVAHPLGWMVVEQPVGDRCRHADVQQPAAQVRIGVARGLLLFLLGRFNNNISLLVSETTLSGVTMSGVFGHGQLGHRVRNFRTRLHSPSHLPAGGVGEPLHTGRRIQHVAAALVPPGPVATCLLLQHEAVLAQSPQVLGDRVLVQPEVVGDAPDVGLGDESPLRVERRVEGDVFEHTPRREPNSLLHDAARREDLRERFGPTHDAAVGQHTAEVLAERHHIPRLRRREAVLRRHQVAPPAGAVSPPGGPVTGNSSRAAEPLKCQRDANTRGIMGRDNAGRNGIAKMRNRRSAA